MSILRSGNFALDISRGLVPGHKNIVINGNNPDMDTGTVPEDIWDGGGLYPGFNATEDQTFDIVSSSVNDTLLGTGAQKVKVSIIDTSFNEVTEIVDLDGQTPVTTTAAGFRCNITFVDDVGSVGRLDANDGTITVTQTTSGIVMDQMNPNVGRTRKACYTVLANSTISVVGGLASLNDSSNDVSVTGDAFVRLLGKGFVRQILFELNSGTGMINLDLKHLPTFPEGTDFCMRVTGVESNNADVTFSLSAIEVTST